VTGVPLQILYYAGAIDGVVQFKGGPVVDGMILAHEHLVAKFGAGWFAAVGAGGVDYYIDDNSRDPVARCVIAPHPVETD
jgi:hypothetical protein